MTASREQSKMGGVVGNWDWKAVSDTFIWRGRDASLRWDECLAKAKAKASSVYQALADEAAAKTSVYNYLDGRSFLSSRAALLAALRQLATMPPPKIGEVFNSERYESERRRVISDLLQEFTPPDGLN